uniref:Dipeptidase n=1 Tax=Poecilia latipinna TaxID=48699 RepID=A0A3B3V8P9_9TELE
MGNGSILFNPIHNCTIFEIKNKMLNVPFLTLSSSCYSHNDLALRLRIHYNNQLSKINLTHLTRVATDISRLRAGHVQTQMFAVYVLCGAQHMDAVRLTLEQIDVIRRICTEYPDFELVTSTQELRDSMTKGKIACLISIEGGHSIDSSLPALRMFYQLGVRSMSLTHSCNTPWYSKEHAVVDEMNRLGMIVDLSHTSFETASAVLNHSKAPVIFSHSSSYMICNNPRNVPDWLLQELVRKPAWLIMVNFYSPFISCQKKATVSHLADHFDYIKGFIGAKSIGIGGDFDGGTSFPVGLEDVSKYPVIVQELLKRNWTEEDLADVLRNNFLRVFEEVEKVRIPLYTVYTIISHNRINLFCSQKFNSPPSLCLTLISKLKSKACVSFCPMLECICMSLPITTVLAGYE